MFYASIRCSLKVLTNRCSRWIIPRFAKIVHLITFIIKNKLHCARGLRFHKVKSRISRFQFCFAVKTFSIKVIGFLLEITARIALRNLMLDLHRQQLWTYAKFCFVYSLLRRVSTNRNSISFKAIRVTAHGCHGVLNHRQLDFLFNSLFRQTTEEISKLHITDLCDKNPLMTGGLPS